MTPSTEGQMARLLTWDVPVLIHLTTPRLFQGDLMSLGAILLKSTFTECPVVPFKVQVVRLPFAQREWASCKCRNLFLSRGSGICFRRLLQSCLVQKIPKCISPISVGKWVCIHHCTFDNVWRALSFLAFYLFVSSPPARHGTHDEGVHEASDPSCRDLFLAMLTRESIIKIDT